MAVALTQETNSDLNAGLSSGGLAILDIILLCESPISEAKFRDRDVRRALHDVRRSAGSQPLANQPIVLDLAGFALPGAELMVVPADGDDGLPCGFVVTILGNTFGQTRHGAYS